MFKYYKVPSYLDVGLVFPPDKFDLDNNRIQNRLYTLQEDGYKIYSKIREDLGIGFNVERLFSCGHVFGGVHYYSQVEQIHKKITSGSDYWVEAISYTDRVKAAQRVRENDCAVLLKFIREAELKRMNWLLLA